MFYGDLVWITHQSDDAFMRAYTGGKIFIENFYYKKFISKATGIGEGVDN